MNMSSGLISASGPSVVKRKTAATSEKKPWSVCQVCKVTYNKTFRFENPNEFGRHLREMHSKREGGSFTCKYGINGICSSLPMEGISDEDYEHHVAKHHVFPKMKANLGSIEQQKRTADRGTRTVSTSRSANASWGTFPAPANFGEIQQQLLTTQPNVVTDASPDQWTMYSVTHNLASVLNDPSVPRVQSEGIFTRDWGTYFTDTGSVSSSLLLPKISSNHFDSFVRKLVVRSRDQRTRSERCQATADADKKTASKAALVPAVFFAPDFDLENDDIFKAILSMCTQCDILEATSSPTRWNTVAKASMVELERNLSDHLDVVEEQLAKQVSARSRDFFFVMNAMDTIMDQLNRAIKEVTHVRRKCDQLGQALIRPSLRSIELTRSRQNAVEACDKMKLISTIHQAQPTIQLLLSTSDYVGSLDLIATSQDVVEQELTGVQSFRHLDSQFKEMAKVIDNMMQVEVTKILTHEWNRPPDANIGPRCVLEEEKLSSLFMGLLRVQRYGFIDLYKEEAYTAIRACLKQTVIENLALEDSVADVSNRADGGLFDQLSCLSFVSWISLLNEVFNSLHVLLKRIEGVYKIIDSSLSAAHNNTNGESMLLPLTGDGGVVLSDNDYDKLKASLLESIGLICDFSHKKCAHLIDTRTKDGSLDKLTPHDFMELARSIDAFTARCQEICSRESPHLKVVLQAQASKFANRFHEERKKKINSLLDIEPWKSLDSVPIEFQNVVDQLEMNDFKFNEVHKNGKQAINSPTKATGYVKVNGQNFVVVSSVLTLVHMIIEYCLCATEVRVVSNDLMTKLVQLLQLFNKRTAQLVLGAGALEVAGLKRITARNLVISSRCLQLVLVFIPRVKNHFHGVVDEGKRQSANQMTFDDVVSSYGEHIEQIEEKVTSVVKDLFESYLLKWEAKPPVPSAQFQAISQHLMRLHENIHDALPVESLAALFTRIQEAFKDVLRLHLTRLRIVNDGGPKHGLVTQELTFYTQNICKLMVSKHVVFTTADLWSTNSAVPSR